MLLRSTGPRLRFQIEVQFVASVSIGYGSMRTLIAAQPWRRLAVGETHGTLRASIVEPCLGGCLSRECGDREISRHIHLGTSKQSHPEKCRYGPTLERQAFIHPAVWNRSLLFPDAVFYAGARQRATANSTQPTMNETPPIGTSITRAFDSVKTQP